MLPRMAKSGGRVLIHHSTVWTESYLLPLVVVIIDGHPCQTFRLVEPVDHILPFTLKRHVRGYYSYQWAIPLLVKEWA